MLTETLVGLALGLLGALFIGTSDAIARVTAQRVALPLLILCVFGLSTPFIGAWLYATDGLPRWDIYLWSIAALSGLLNVIALGFLYTALARGPVSLASPAAASFTVMLVFFNILAGEPYGPIQVVSILLVFVGVAMLARGERTGDGTADAAADQTGGADRRRPEWSDPAYLRVTLLFALLTALSVSLRFFLAQEATEGLGAFETLFLTRAIALAAAAVGVAGLVAARGRAALRAPIAGAESLVSGRVVMTLVLAQAALEAAALGAFLAGGALGDRIAVTIGFSAFAAISPIVAWLWLGDPLTRRRVIWIFIVVAGAALSALPPP